MAIQVIYCDNCHKYQPSLASNSDITCQECGTIIISLMPKVSQGIYEVFDNSSDEFNLWYRLVNAKDDFMWYQQFNNTLEPANGESEGLEAMYQAVGVVEDDNTNSS